MKGKERILLRKIFKETTYDTLFQSLNCVGLADLVRLVLEPKLVMFHPCPFIRLVPLRTLPMNCLKICRLFTLMSLVLSWSMVVTSGQEPADAQEILEREKHFTLVVLPIMQRRCFACHGKNPDDLKGDLDVSNIEGLLKGGESGSPGIE